MPFVRKKERERPDYDALISENLNGFTIAKEDGTLVDLVTFLEAEEWHNLALRPRQRLVSKIVNNAIAHCARTPLLRQLPWERIRLDTRKWWQIHVEDHNEPPALTGLDHAITTDADGSVWYDEEADFEFMKSRQDRYANLIVRLDGDQADPLIILLVLGRGGTKTTMAAGFSAWLTHIIMAQADPHRYFALNAQKSLKIQNVATAEIQANEFFQAYKTAITNITWFDGRYDDKEKSIEFGRLPGKASKPVPQLIAAMASANSRSGRGGDVVVYVHDEMAHSEKDGDGKVGARSDKSLWRAYFAAVRTRGKARGIGMCLSSPAEADGKLYELFEGAENGRVKNVVMIQVSTWGMIPGHTRENYQDEYDLDPDGADMEYGAQFYSGQSNLIPNAEVKLDRAVENGKLLGLVARRAHYFQDERLKDPQTGKYRRDLAQPWDYWAHLDTSKGGNRLALAVAHMEGPFTVLDHLRIWERLPHYRDELEPYIIRLHQHFGGLRGMSFDQYNSLELIQNLTDAGIRAEELTFTAEINDALARNLMSIMSEKSVTLAVYPTEFMGPLPKKGGGWDDGPDEADIAMWIARKEIAAAKKIYTARTGSKEKRFWVAGVAPTTGTITTDDALDAIMAACYKARMAVMGGGGFAIIDPNGPAGSVGRAELLAQAVEDGKSLEGFGMQVNCAHCYNVWTDMTGAPLVACPNCGQYTQARMMR
jgi:hypothetical protein